MNQSDLMYLLRINKEIDQNKLDSWFCYSLIFLFNVYNVHNIWNLKYTHKNIINKYNLNFTNKNKKSFKN